MSNNTYKHISDKSIYNTFDPAGTNFPANIKTVQEALALTSPTSYATATQAGVIALATKDEVLAGIDSKKAVTPATLNERLKYPGATTTVVGVLSLATNTEALAGTVANKAIVPSSLKHVIDWSWANRVSTEVLPGTIKISSTAAAGAGVDDTTAMTPLKVAQAIAAATSQIPSYANATEAAAGLVRLATVGQVNQGTLRDGYAISPYTLSRLTGSLTSKGIVQAATQTQANLGTDDGLYISAKGFKTYVASTTNVGTVKLSEVKAVGSGMALSSNAKVLFTTGPAQAVDSDVNFTKVLKSKGSPVASEQHVLDSMPIGSAQMYFGDTAPLGGKWVICDGPEFSKAQYPELFAVIGYKFGGSGDTFYGPDTRGLFMRGAGVGQAILAERGVDDKNKPLLGNDVSGGTVGEVQKQQTRTHKHVIPWGESYGNSSFGQTATRHYVGSGKSDSNNPRFFSNDGLEVDHVNQRGDYNTLNTVDAMGSETRPWNMSVNYIIKVK